MIEHTYKIVSHTFKLDASLKFRISENLSCYWVVAHIMLVHGDSFRALVHFNYTGTETLLEFFCEMRRNGFFRVEDD